MLDYALMPRCRAMFTFRRFVAAAITPVAATLPALSLMLCHYATPI